MTKLTGYWEVNLTDVIKTVGKDAAKKCLSGYSCPKNPDIEDYMHNKAIVFAEQGISSTHIVSTSFKGNTVIVGFYALTNKVFTIRNAYAPNANWRRRLNRFSEYNKEMKCHMLSLPLIGQLGKNYANGYDNLISGDELLMLACKRIKSMQRDFGGKIAYVECEDVPFLIHFYQSNGFVLFGKRETGPADAGLIKAKYLVQLMRYFDD